MEATLTWFIRIWVGLAVALNALAIIGIFLAEPTFWAGWARVAKTFNPFNVTNFAAEMLLLSPAFAAYAWREKRRKSP